MERCTSEVGGRVAVLGVRRYRSLEKWHRFMMVVGFVSPGKVVELGISVCHEFDRFVVSLLSRCFLGGNCLVFKESCAFSESRDQFGSEASTVRVLFRALVPLTDSFWALLRFWLCCAFIRSHFFPLNFPILSVSNAYIRSRDKCRLTEKSTKNMVKARQLFSLA